MAFSDLRRDNNEYFSSFWVMNEQHLVFSSDA